MPGYKGLADEEIIEISKTYFAKRETKSKPAETPAIVFIGHSLARGKAPPQR